MRQIVLDTETTGLSPKEGHRIIEIGAVELVNRRVTGKYYHCYLNPDREVEEGAIKVHGITNDFLADKLRFPAIVEEFIQFIDGAELVIHNAPFDVGFINHEFALLPHFKKQVADYCTVLDSLELARKLHPGQKNSLDAVCKRYQVDNSNRKFHGALLDANLLAEAYLAMTGGQISLEFNVETAVNEMLSQEYYENTTAFIKQASSQALPIVRASADERALHDERISELRSKD